MRIITLLENHENKDRKDLRSEHGLSFYIEKKDHVFMSDVGQSGHFADNAAKLGLDLPIVEGLSVSHHHYDHGGGLKRFFEVNHKATVYMRSSPDDVDYIADDPPKPARYIGLDKGLLRDYEDRIIKISENQEPLPGFHLITEIPDDYLKPSGDQRLKMRRKDEKNPDTFDHELVMVLEGDQGLVVLTGCAHNGVLNMVAATQKWLPDRPIQALIGGFHLHHEDASTVRMIAEKLLDLDIPMIYTGHCTGDDALDILEDVLGDRLGRLFTGMVMEF